MLGCLGSLDLWLCGYLGAKKSISACRRGVNMYMYIHICVYIYRDRYLIKAQLEELLHRSPSPSTET